MNDSPKPEKADFRVIEYPFHMGDLVGGTTNLNDEQFGAYMRLLIANINAQAKKGGLPANQEILRSYTRMGPAAWKKLWLLIGEKFVEESGIVYHPRVKETVNAIINASNGQRDKALKKHNSDNATAQPEENHGTTNPKTHKPINLKPRDINPNPDSKPREGDSGFSILEKGAAPSARGFKIEYHLQDKDRERLKAMARDANLDFYYLQTEYDEWIAKKGPPDNPVAGFTAFVKKKAKNG